MGWESLPELVLIEVFAYLCPPDRYSACLVCRAWSPTIHEPRVWRFHRVGLYTDPTMAEKMSECIGPSVRALEVAGLRKRTYFGPMGPIAISRRFASQLGLLKYRGCRKLTSLRIKNLRDMQRWRDGMARKRVIASLKHFINGQTRLQYLEMENTCLRVPDVVQMLMAAAYKSGGSLRALRLRHALRACQGPVSLLPNLWLARLRQLHTLSLRYALLTDEFMVALPNTLKHLSLEWCTDDTDMVYLPKESAWRNLVARLPQLQVDLTVVGTPLVFQTKNMVPEKLPLRALKIINVPEPDQVPWDLRPSLIYVLAYFRTSLEEFNVQMRNSFEPLDDILLQFLEMCPKLYYFRFQGALAYSQTVKEMCMITNFYGSKMDLVEVRALGYPWARFGDINCLVENNYKRIDVRLLRSFHEAAARTN